MKIAGQIVLGLGLLVALVIAMAPTSVEVFGAEGSCGPSLLRVIAQQDSDDRDEQALIDRCEELAGDRLVVAGVVALAVVIVGGGLLLAARRSAGPTAPGPRPGPAAPVSPGPSDAGADHRRIRRRGDQAPS